VNKAGDLRGSKILFAGRVGNRGRSFLAGRISIKAVRPRRRARRRFLFQFHSYSTITKSNQTTLGHAVVQYRER